MGKVVLKLERDISTDDIYPGRFMATVLPTETPQYCFFNRTEFNARLNAKEIPPGSVVIADENFGCGSSREQAASTIRGHELVVIAKSIARIFMQNAINLGLELVVCPDIEAELGDDIEVLPGKVRNLSSGKDFATVPLPPARQAIVDAGGLIPYTRKKLLEQQAG
ncbi:MAG: 3-isopropylmalate dehydratase [Myxococcota bacterium]|jgi:3-isopropylmalate/(R)-2-methylmalate dehydratase small subunit|nr:3-isopropylmalate dehydratase [Myxococcota bacterium]